MPDVAAATTTVPFMFGWMWQWYVYVPEVGKVRVTVVLAFTPGMSAGAPGVASKNTLCPTDPNENVTTPAGATVIVAGENERFGFAFTVAALGDGVGVVGAVVEDEPHASGTVASEPTAMRLRNEERIVSWDEG